MSLALIPRMEWIDFFRNCKHCGFGISNNGFKKIDFFCNICWAKLEKYKTKDHVVIYKTPEILVRPLFLWDEKECIVKDLIHGLKGGTPKKVLETLSLEFSNRFTADRETVVIPVPSSKVGEKDHSYVMAKVISEGQNLELWDGLEWKYKKTNQKFLSKTERFVSEMRTTKSLSIQRRVILIDDLVTTGATAMAAYKAFKGLNQIEVWSLACRL
jgi:predicted amidophosphoribosyltransferase